MPMTEVQRFANDLAQKPDLLANVKPFATGLTAFVALGKQHGYDFTVAEAKQYIQSRSPQELTDRQLDAVAGGKNVQSSPFVPGMDMESAAVVTTVVDTNVQILSTGTVAAIIFI